MADVVFDNSVNDLHSRFDPGALEVGDEIILTGAARLLTNFSFEFWGTNTLSPGNITFAGLVQARVRFYLNDGAFGMPGTTFFDSGWFSVPYPTPRNIFVFQAGSGFPPSGLWIAASDITWTIQFQGMGATDKVGVDVFSPPIVGMDFTDYWQRDLSGWTLKTNAQLNAIDFAARFQAATGSPPAPSLQITHSGNQVILSWPLSASNYLLESSSNLVLKAWNPQTNGISISGPNYVFTNVATLPASFYRLHLH